MENTKNAIPKKEEYKIKYVFKNDSNLDINEVIKECFIAKLRTQKIATNPKEFMYNTLLKYRNEQ